MEIFKQQKEKYEEYQEGKQNYINARTLNSVSDIVFNKETERLKKEKELLENVISKSKQLEKTNNEIVLYSTISFEDIDKILVRYLNDYSLDRYVLRSLSDGKTVYYYISQKSVGYEEDLEQEDTIILATESVNQMEIWHKAAISLYGIKDDTVTFLPSGTDYLNSDICQFLKEYIDEFIEQKSLNNALTWKEYYEKDLYSYRCDSLLLDEEKIETLESQHFIDNKAHKRISTKNYQKWRRYNRLKKQALRKLELIPEKYFK